MSNQPPSYLNVSADLTFLQRIMCCNYFINDQRADEPPQAETPTSQAIKFTFAEDTPTVKETPVEIKNE